MSEPSVTVVIPVRDEAERLPDCLAAVAAQDLTLTSVEVLVVDGGSSDGTVDVARRLLANHPWCRSEVLHSPAGDRSSNLNRGLEAATSPILVRVDARSRIPVHYVRRCVELLTERGDVAVVGGRQRAIAVGRGALATGVPRALNNRWGMGLARYRRAGSTSGVTDTVYLGAYRTAQLLAVGGWRANLAVNEDFDLNRRLTPFGRVWFDAGLTVDYLPRSSLGALLRQYWAFGLGKAHYWRTSSDRPQRRQVVLLAAPAAGVSALVGALVTAGPGAALAVAAAGVVGAVAVEALGADGPPAGLSAHMCAVGALACVAGGWLAGVTAGFVLPVVTRFADPDHLRKQAA